MASSAAGGKLDAAVQSDGAVLAWGLVNLQGRIVAMRRTRGQDKNIETILRLAAADVYSSPATIRVYSSSKIGNEHDDVQIQCRVAGYARRIQGGTDDLGERTPPRMGADNTLTFVGHI